MPRRTFRYPGLVRAMREVRLAIARPLSAEEARRLADRVDRLLDDVRAAAGDAGLSPRSLPPPSRQAFDYLDAIDFAGVAGSVAAGPAPAPTLRIARLVAGRDQFLRRLRRTANDRAVDDAGAIRSEMAATAAEVAILCERAGVAPSALPDPSRRAYQWLSFLAEGGNLEAHLRAQAEAASVDPRLRVDLYHLGALYRFAWRHDGVDFMLSEAFLDAPPTVLHAAVKLALPYTRKRQHRRVLAAFAAGEAFEGRLLQLETAGGAFVEHTRGLVHDLEAAFRRVNDAMFGGRLTRPRLSWLASTSLREFGHYAPATDLVLISSQLDAPTVPEFVVDHVVHHELLHRQLGARLSGGRRVFHTADFRRQERLYPKYAEADAFLQRLARG